MPNPSRETKLSGANADREIFIFPVQPTTCRIGNLTWLIHTLAVCDDLYMSKGKQGHVKLYRALPYYCRINNVLECTILLVLFKRTVQSAACEDYNTEQTCK